VQMLFDSLARFPQRTDVGSGCRNEEGGSE
jgi:hypothetical protein